MNNLFGNLRVGKAGSNYSITYFGTVAYKGKTWYNNTVYDCQGMTIDLGRIPTFSTGGFPEDGLFMANHNELVGQFSNGRTAVANNEQIVEAVSEGVYSAMVAAMKQSEGNGGQSFNIYLDGRQLVSTIEKRQRERGATIMRNGVYAY